MSTMAEQAAAEREPKQVLASIAVELYNPDDGTYADMTTHWIYEDTRPYEVDVSFPEDASDPDSTEKQNTWTFSRENLDKTINVGFSEDKLPGDGPLSVEETIGEGDVVMYTKSDSFFVFFVLRTDKGMARLRVGKPELALFLNETFRLVPPGGEEAYQQLEIEFDLLQQADQSP